MTGPTLELSPRAVERVVKEVLRRLEEHRDRIAEILAESARPLLAFAADRHILGVNPAAGDVLGWAPHELEGRPLDDLVPSRWRSSLASVLPTNGELVTIDLPVHRRDGSELRASLTLGGARGGERAGGEPVFVMFVRQREQIDDGLDELYANEERFRLLIEGVREYALFMLDADGRVATWNSGAERTKGWTEEEVLGQPYDVFFGAEDRAAGVPAQLLASARLAGSVEATGWHVRRDGEMYFVESFVTSLYASRGTSQAASPAASREAREGQFRGYAVVTHDLSSSLRAVENELRLAAEKTAREAAELSEQRLRSVHRLALALSSAVTPEEVAAITLSECLREVDAAGGSVFTLGPDEDVLTLLAERGHPAHVIDPFRSMPLATLTPASDAARTGVPGFYDSAAACIERYPALRSAIAAGELEAVSAVPLTVRARVIGVLVVRYARPRSFDAAARSQHLTMAELCAQALDRARLFAAERIARADAERAAQRATGILESMGDAFVALDEAWRITSVNRRQEGITQTRREDVLGKSLWEVFPAAADPRSKYWIELHRCVAERARVHFEEHYPPLDLWTELDAYPAPDGGVVVFFRDVTARKRLEAERVRLYEEAKASEEQFRALADTIPALAWYAEPDGNIPWYNRRWHEYTGATADEQKGWGWQSVHDPADLPRILERWRAALASGEPWEDTFRLRGHDGVMRWFLSRAAPLRDARGRVVRWFGTNVDIDDQKRAEADAALLNEIGAVLVSSLELGGVLERVTARLVPSRADGAYVVLVRDDGEPPAMMALVHRDGRRAAIIRELHRRMGLHRPAVGLARVLDTGRSALAAVITDEERGDGVRDPAERALVDELGTVSSVVVPLAVEGRTLGALGLEYDVSSRCFDRRDLAMAEELARRLALAVDRARLFELAQSERRRAEDANRAKDEFLAVVSHELRTPLNAVLGWTRMLRAGTLAEGQAPRALETIERNATAQAALINDILDVSRIITGKLRLDVAPADLHDILESAVDALRTTADAKGVRVVATLEPSAPVIGDPARLQQVVWNLISNALKFTPRGGRVLVRLSRVGSNAEIVVEDTGEGIDPAFLPHVFERFRQQDGTTTRAHGGLGLGLAIVRHLVELHGGSVRASSEGKGRGARLVVELPMASLRLKTAAPPPLDAGRLLEGTVPAQDCPSGLGGLRVLVVDDEPDARDMVSAMLLRCDVQVRAVSSAREALIALDEAGFDAIVSDVGMPVEDGYALIEKVRLRPADRGGRTPAVALTAYARVEDRTRALLAGFQMHLAKPVDPAELLSVLANVAGRFPQSVEARPGA